MIRIRIGNDIPIEWSFFSKEAGENIPYILEGKDIRIEMADAFGKRSIMDFTVSGNTVNWNFRGKDQKNIGVYSFTFYENFGKMGMKALDKIQPFRLVSEQETVESGTVEGSCSTFEVSPIIMRSELSGAIDYESLINLPKINHVILTGDKTAEELGLTHPYLSLERLRPFLYKVTFDSLPEDNGEESPALGGCSSYVKDGRLYTNLDWDYGNTASFRVITRDFDGQSFVRGLNDGELDDGLIAQLPYMVHRGINNHGIKVAAHVLYNDWEWKGCGERNVNLTRLPFLVLSKVKSMATLVSDLEGALDNLYCPEGLADMEYLLQLIVTDGTTTYALMPPTGEGQSYVAQDITSNPKLANFRWESSEIVERAGLQTRPTGVERWNMMPCPLEDLRFTKAYEAPDRLSEFIGIDGTTKSSTDAELEVLYAKARAEYLTRKRDGKTWQTMESAIYGEGMESLWIQENWSDDILGNITKDLERIAGYDASKTQVLKNVNGTFVWETIQGKYYILKEEQ